ncbi:MAG: hypothetical protein ACOY4R_27790 [Pseudomonadota bacterium]
MPISLRSYTITIAAGTTTAVAIGAGDLDYRFDGTQYRRVSVQLANASDSVLVEGSLDGTTWFSVNAAITGNTNVNAIALTGPYKQLRATKTGTNGAATITAIV